MKVTDVKAICFKQPKIPLHGWTGQQELILTKVITDGGLEGYSFSRAHGGTSGRVIAECITVGLKGRVVGQDPLDREKIWQSMFQLEPASYVPIFAISAIDVALWDLAGKILNVPLFKLIGGRKDKILAYASSAHMSTIDAYIKDLNTSLGRGFKAYKIHPFGVPDKDIELCRAVRKAAGDNVKLMLDVTKNYDRMSAMRVGRVLEELNFTWFEEPISQYDIEGNAELSRALEIPVIGGETIAGSAYSIANFIRASAFDMVLCDVYWKCGVTGMLKTATLCETMGIKVASHHGASPLMNFANLHVLCGGTNADMIEILVPEEGYNFALKSYLKIDKDGYLHAPQSPGLGAEIDWEYIKTNNTAEM